MTAIERESVLNLIEEIRVSPHWSSAQADRICEVISGEVRALTAAFSLAAAGTGGSSAGLGSNIDMKEAAGRDALLPPQPSSADLPLPRDIHEWLVWAFRNGASYQQANPDEPIGSIRPAAEAWATSFGPPSAALPGKDVGVEQLADLVRNAQALLDLDAKGVLVPHGIGGLAREIIAKFIAISALVSQPHPEGEAVAGLEIAAAWHDAEQAKCFARLRTLRRKRGATTTPPDTVSLLTDEAVGVASKADFHRRSAAAIRALRPAPHNEAGARSALDFVRALIRPDIILFAADIKSEKFGRKEIFNAFTYLTRTGELAHIGYGKYQSPPEGPATSGHSTFPLPSDVEKLVEALREISAMEGTTLLSRAHGDVYAIGANAAFSTAAAIAHEALAALSTQEGGGK